MQFTKQPVVIGMPPSAPSVDTSSPLIYIDSLHLRPRGLVMLDSDLTFTSPLAVAAQTDGPLLALTIGWHPDIARIGEQYLWADSTAALELSRFFPLFQRPAAAPLGLGYGGISREPVRFVQDGAGGVDIGLPGGRMVVELDGNEIRGSAHLSHAQIAAGAVLVLGRTVLLCLHWMDCLPKDNPVAGWLGVGHAAVRTRDQIRQVAGTDATVLLLGETGTGKEVAARAIHALSRRAHAALVSVNMAALNESLAAADLFGAGRGAYTGAQTARAGLFAEAQDATLFLDEVGNTAAAVQPMLLRVLETGDYRPLGGQRDLHSNARLIAATDQDLHADGFNQALLRRLENFTIHMPPLRARREDIGLLIAHLLASSAQAGTGIGFPAGLVAQFVGYDWPGNVRQLNHVFKRCLLALQGDQMPDFDALVRPHPSRTDAASTSKAGAAMPAPPTPTPARKKLQDLGEHEVLQAMEENHWAIQGAAQTLGVSRPSMYKLLEAHSQIRPAARIDTEEIRIALTACGGDVENCAARLKTPAEALRRHMRSLGMLS